MKKFTGWLFSFSTPIPLVLAIVLPSIALISLTVHFVIWEIPSNSSLRFYLLTAIIFTTAFIYYKLDTKKD